MERLAIETAPQRPALPAGPSVEGDPGYLVNVHEQQAAEAAASADAHRQERQDLRGQADRNLAAHDEKVVADAREARDAQLHNDAFIDAHAKSLHEQGGPTEDGAVMEERLRVAGEAGSRAGQQAVERDHLWEATYAAKVQEMNAGKVVDPSDPNDAFHAAARDAADAAVAQYDRAHLPRVDKMADVQPFGEGAAAGREAAEKARRKRAEAEEARRQDAFERSGERGREGIQEREERLKQERIEKARAAAAAAAGGQGGGQGGDGGGDGGDHTEVLDAVDDDEDYVEEDGEYLEGQDDVEDQPEVREKRRFRWYGPLTFGSRGRIKERVDNAMRGLHIEASARKEERKQRIGEMWHALPLWKRVGYRVGDVALNGLAIYGAYRLLGAAGGAIFGHDGGAADGGVAPDTTPDYTVEHFQVNEELSGGERWLWDGWEHANPDMSQGEIRGSLLDNLDKLREAGFDVQMRGDVDDNGHPTGPNWYVHDIVAPDDTAFVHDKTAETLDGRHFNTTAEKVGLLWRADEFDDGKMVDVDNTTIDQLRDLEKEAEAQASAPEKDEKDHNPVAVPETNEDDNVVPAWEEAVIGAGLVAAGALGAWQVRKLNREQQERQAAAQADAEAEAAAEEDVEEAEEEAEAEQPAAVQPTPERPQLTEQEAEQVRQFIKMARNRIPEDRPISVDQLAERIIKGRTVTDQVRLNIRNALIMAAQEGQLNTVEVNGSRLITR